MTTDLPSSLSNPQPRRQDFLQGSKYVAASLSEQLRPLLRWGALQLCRGVAPTSPRMWKSGVILGPDHIGDVLYNTAALPALREGLPGCKWTCVTPQSSSAVLRHNPNLEEIIAIEAYGSFSGRLAQYKKALSGKHFDVAIAYAGGPAWKDLVLAAALGIPNRVAYVHKGFSGLVTHPMRMRFPQPFPAYFRDLVCQLVEYPVERCPSLRPLLYPQPEHELGVDRISSKIGLDWTKRPVLACAVTSRQPWGVWPKEQFLKSIRYVRQNEPCTVIYFGAKSDAEDLSRLASQTGSDTFVLAGDLNLLEVVALLRRCRVALTTDSGPRHLSNGAGIPVVFIRNITFRKEEAGAYCETDNDMAPPDLDLVKPNDVAAAFARINPEAVGERVVELLRKPKK